MKRNNVNKDVIKDFHKANRELQFERNGGGQFVSMHSVHKSKKAYNRRENKKIDF